MFDQQYQIFSDVHSQCQAYLSKTMLGNYTWPLIVSFMLATSNALQQESPSGLGIEPFSAIKTTLTPDSYYVKVQQSSTKVMISTGYPRSSATKTTVIIDLEDSNVICEDLDDFPMEMYVGVGMMFMFTL